MIVVTMANCPPSLRGDLTKWLFEVSVGVYVGRVSARVREELWDRICRSVGSGRASMVWATNNEQGLDFRVQNSEWEPIDFDGLKLMMHPSLERLKQKNHPARMSDAAKYRLARRRDTCHTKQMLGGDGYVAIHIETTGLMPEQDEIIEIAALRVRKGVIEGTYHSLIQTERELPSIVSHRTGITLQLLQADARPLREAFSDFLMFIDKEKIVSYNAKRDRDFMNASCRQLGFESPVGQICDTARLAKKELYQLPKFDITTVVAHFGIQPQNMQPHGISMCHMTHEVYKRLLKSKEI